MSGRRRWAESANLCVCVHARTRVHVFLGCDSLDEGLKASGEVFHWTSIQQSSEKPSSPTPSRQGADGSSAEEGGQVVVVVGSGGSVLCHVPSAGSHYRTDETL